MIPRNLRINADDFGLSPAISRAIVRAARQGLINSASVVPFRDVASSALFAELAAVEGIGIGAHLTFIEVPFLTSPGGTANATPPNTYGEFVTAFVKGKVRTSHVRDEWRAQIELLSKRLGHKRLSHLDSHQHIHLMPGVWEVARELQQEYGIPFLRVPLERSWNAWRKDPPMGAGLQVLSLLRSRASTETFFGVGTSMAFRAASYRHKADEIIAHPERRYELMVHPDETERGVREMEELRRWLHSCAS